METQLDDLSYVARATRHWEYYDKNVWNAIWKAFLLYSDDEDLLVNRLRMIPSIVVEQNIKKYGQVEAQDEVFIKACIQIMASLALLNRTDIIDEMLGLPLQISKSTLNTLDGESIPELYGLWADRYTLRQIYKKRNVITVNVSGKTVRLGTLIKQAVFDEEK